MKNTNEWEWVWYVPIDVGKEEVLSLTKWRPNIQDRLKTWNGDGEARVNPQNGIVKVSQLFIKDFFLFLFLKNNYNMMLTPQLESFPPRPQALCTWGSINSATRHLAIYQRSYHLLGKSSWMIKDIGLWYSIFFLKNYLFLYFFYIFHIKLF